MRAVFVGTEAGGGAARDFEFLHRVPFAAVRAAALPLHRRAAAFFTDVFDAGFGHFYWSPSTRTGTRGARAHKSS